MKKLAFFVEGTAEVSFIEKLLSALFTAGRIAFDIQRITGGSSVPIQFETIRAVSTTSPSEFYVLIYNCNGETNVKSYIEQRKNNLASKGYTVIIGIRDVFPNFTRAEIPKLLYGLNTFATPNPAVLSTRYILSVMEIESTFLAEHTHFTKIDPALTVGLIMTNLGFDPSVDDMELRANPAADLNACYNLVGKNYAKSLTSINRTTSAIDYAEIYVNVRTRISYINDLISEIENALF